MDRDKEEMDFPYFSCIPVNESLEHACTFQYVLHTCLECMDRNRRNRPVYAHISFLRRTRLWCMGCNRRNRGDVLCTRYSREHCSCSLNANATRNSKDEASQMVCIPADARQRYACTFRCIGCTCHVYKGHNHRNLSVCEHSLVHKHICLSCKHCNHRIHADNNLLRDLCFFYRFCSWLAMVNCVSF